MVSGVLLSRIATPSFRASRQDVSSPSDGTESPKRQRLNGGRKILLRRDRLDVFFFETHQEHSIFRHCVPYGLVF